MSARHIIANIDKTNHTSEYRNSVLLFKNVLQFKIMYLGGGKVGFHIKGNYPGFSTP